MFIDKCHNSHRPILSTEWSNGLISRCAFNPWPLTVTLSIWLEIWRLLRCSIHTLLKHSLTPSCWRRLSSPAFHSWLSGQGAGLTMDTRWLASTARFHWRTFDCHTAATRPGREHSRRTLSASFDRTKTADGRATSCWHVRMRRLPATILRAIQSERVPRQRLIVYSSRRLTVNCGRDTVKGVL